jgi:hypothetical protein
MVRAAKERGLSGIAITDHDSVGGWRGALKAGKELDVLIIPGEEVSVFRDEKLLAHVLGLFLEDKIKARAMPDVAEEIHDQGGLAVIAHPLDRFRRPYTDLKKHLGYFDAIEVFNSHTLFAGDNQIAREFALKNKKPMTGGSDAHSRYEVGCAYTEAKANNLEEFRKAVLKGKTAVEGRKTNPVYHVFSVLSKRRLYPFRDRG